MRRVEKEMVLLAQENASKLEECKHELETSGIPHHKIDAAIERCEKWTKRAIVRLKKCGSAMRRRRDAYVDKKKCARVTQRLGSNLIQSNITGVLSVLESDDQPHPQHAELLAALKQVEDQPTLLAHAESIG
jgi:hypothetical protein